MFLLHESTFALLKLASNRLLAQLLNAHAINAGGLGFKSRAGQVGTVSPSLRRVFGAV